MPHHRDYIYIYIIESGLGRTAAPQGVDARRVRVEGRRVRHHVRQPLHLPSRRLGFHRGLGLLSGRDSDSLGSGTRRTPQARPCRCWRVFSPSRVHIPEPGPGRGRSTGDSHRLHAGTEAALGARPGGKRWGPHTHRNLHAGGEEALDHNARTRHRFYTDFTRAGNSPPSRHRRG